MAAGDLTTVEKARTHIGIKSADADGVLAQLVSASSAWVTRYIGRAFGTATITETVNGDGTSRMLLKQSPIASVTSVTVDTVPVPQRTEVGGAGWVYSDGGVDLVGYSFTKGIQNVVFVYSAGEAVPADLEQAVLEHVAVKWRRRGNEGQASANIGGDSVSYASEPEWRGILEVLDSYRGLVFS